MLVLLFDVPAQVKLGSILGLASHLLLYIRGEWHVKAPFMLSIYGFSAILIFLVNLAICSQGILSAKYTTVFVLSYTISVLFSISIYRYFFHKLRRFPGPPLAGVTKFWHVWQCRNSKNHLVLHSLEKDYGPIVRTGPSELTVFLPEFVPVVDGPGSVCDRAVWYDIPLPQVAVNTTRNRGLHDKRRRVWDHGFTPASLDSYGKRMVVYAERLQDCISRLANRGESVDVSLWFQWFTFDVMGDFAFGASFNMLQDGKLHYVIMMLRRAMSLLGPLSPVPWLVQVGIQRLYWLPVFGAWHSMRDWSNQRMSERVQNGSNRSDVFQWLLEASEDKSTYEMDLHWLQGDASAIIVAGGDSVACTLVYAFHELALDPKHSMLLRQELEGVDIYSHRALESCDYLNGFINETLRLRPVVPTNGYRQVPAGGISVAGTFIPEGTTIVTPRWSFGRSERCYVNAETFTPQRWYSRPELIKDKRAFKPFGQGRYGCIGKQLALRELRFVIAMLVQKFDVRFAAGEDGTTVWKEARDLFALIPGSLKLAFTAMEEGQEKEKVEMIEVQ